MTDSDQPPDPGDVADLLTEGNLEKAVVIPDGLADADADTRKRALRMVRKGARERPDAFDGLSPQFETFLTDDDRAVRLSTAKLFVTLASSEPALVSPVVDALAARLADDEEFYYVRARCAEALGYVALESPGDVTDPGTLADLRIGLSFDEPEVREKLAKALAYVALGDPGRLRHRAASLAEHLDDDNDLVRYHLCTALAVVGCEYPGKLSGATEALSERLDDENPYVRGRAAEALAVVVGSGRPVDPTPDPERIDSGAEDCPTFLADRAEFLRAALADDGGAEETPTDLGTVESIREGTGDAVEAMTSADSSGCPHCGLDLPEGTPPMCPRCGAPH